MTDTLPAALDALVAAEEHLRNPVRFRYLQGLAERAAQCRHAVLRRALEARLAQALKDEGACPWPAASVTTQTERGAATSSAPGRTGLRALLAQLEQGDVAPAAEDSSLTALMQQQAMAALQQHSAVPPASLQVSSANGLRAAASLQPERSRQHVTQLLASLAAQAPADAGPLNSQRLVVKALQTLQEIAPEYLQHLLTQLETLQWLEQAEPPQKR